jgi:hypothetical protein
MFSVATNEPINNNVILILTIKQKYIIENSEKIQSTTSAYIIKHLKGSNIVDILDNNIE